MIDICPRLGPGCRGATDCVCVFVYARARVSATVLVGPDHTPEGPQSPSLLRARYLLHTCAGPAAADLLSAVKQVKPTVLVGLDHTAEGPKFNFDQQVGRGGAHDWLLKCMG